MVNYVRRGGFEPTPPPWRCDDIHVTVFYLAADPTKLQELCDRTLNLPSGPDPRHSGQTRLKYQPCVSWVALTFQRFTNLHSIAASDAGSPILGNHTYSEAAFWVLVMDPAAGGLKVMIPYMFVDDNMCLAAGREIFGFPKEFADIALPPATDLRPLRFAVDALAVGRGTQQATRQPIFSCVRKVFTVPASLEQLRVASTEAVVEALSQDQVLANMGALYNEFLSGSLTFAFLRQFRALRGGPGADLQQVTTAVATPFRIHLPSVRILLNYELHLSDLQTHTITQDFGFAANPLSVPFGFQCNLAFTLREGDLL
jgi:hypothetical protein